MNVDLGIKCQRIPQHKAFLKLELKEWSQVHNGELFVAYDDVWLKLDRDVFEDSAISLTTGKPGIFVLGGMVNVLSVTVNKDEASKIKLFKMHWADKEIARIATYYNNFGLNGSNE